jgi:hypothetical protein
MTNVCGMTKFNIRMSKENEKAKIKAALNVCDPTDLVSVERMILDFALPIVANHGVHRDKLDGGRIRRREKFDVDLTLFAFIGVHSPLLIVEHQFSFYVPSVFSVVIPS